METLIRFLPSENVLMGLYFFSMCVLFLFGCYGLVMIYYFHRTRNNVVSVERPLGELVAENGSVYPMVTIQLPVFNEAYVVERIVKTVCEMDYPKERLEIQILDDSTDDTVEVCRELAARFAAQGYDIKHLHRTNREGFKAGALKAGLATAKGEFIAIFDADFVPKKDFLQRTIPHFFNNEKTGMVQTRWEHLNENYSFLTRVQALALDGHFVMDQQVANKAGFFIIFNGTAGVWRKSTIIDAGNWQHDTITEDRDLSYRAQLRGWKFVYLNDVTSPAELPAEINALKSQQFRWTKGAIEVAKKLVPMVWKSDISLSEKVHCSFHLTNNIVYPFITLVAMLNVPLVLIKNTIGGFDTIFTIMGIFTLASVSTFAFYTYAQWNIHEDWRKRILLFPVFMAGSTGLALNNTRAVFEALFNKKTEFVRTPKYGTVTAKEEWRTNKYKQKKISKTIFFELGFALYYLVGIAVSIYFLEISILPFQMMFLMGFATIGLLSARHALTK